MADYTNVIMTLVAMAFNYLVVYRKNYIVGDIMFIIIGLLSTVFAGINVAIGILIMAGGIISFMYDLKK